MSPRLLCGALLALLLLALTVDGRAQGSAAGVEADRGAASKPTSPIVGQGRLRSGPTPPFDRFRGILGYAFIIGLCYLLSRQRRQVRWRALGWAVGLQVVLALIVLNPYVGQFFFDTVDVGVRKLLGFAEAGIDFTFQSVTPHQMTYQGAPGEPMTTKVIIGEMSPALKSLALSVLPTVIFFSSLITLLYHLGAMQWVVAGMARAMVYVLGTSGAETLSCCANVFIGQTEAPLLVRPFIGRMTQSELMAVMTGGFATVAGGVLAIYVGMLRDLPGIAGHLVTASVMAVPATLGLSKLLVPETESPVTAGTVKAAVDRPDANAIEALARGATDGMQLLLNIAAMLIAFVAMVALINALLGLVGTSLEQLLGWVMSPLAWLIGIPWGEAPAVGQLLGTKLVLTELLAYIGLQKMIAAPVPVLSARSAVISSYALCGFANVASIGIQIGGIGAMAPERRGDLARLGIKAMFTGALVSLMSGAIAGLLL